LIAASAAAIRNLEMDQLSIQGTLNFRAVAPYRTSAARLKSNSLYRSGEFHDVTAAGLDGLRAIGVTTVFDLRNKAEKDRRPSPFLDLVDFKVETEPHDIRHGDLAAALADARSTPLTCKQIMESIYAGLPEQFAFVYARYLHTVGDCPSPVAVHCAAGKDRTGVGVALLLDLLEVSRDDIMEDYLKTNAVRDVLRHRFRNRTSYDDAGNIDHLIDPVVTADPAYLHAMFSVIDREFGSTHRYVRNRLGLKETSIERLRLRLLS
jgi:protein-tyrosine phosphatase